MACDYLVHNNNSYCTIHKPVNADQNSNPASQSKFKRHTET